jgi:hypothetical protein
MTFFNIILVDLLSKPSEFFTGDKSYIDRLKEICANPRMGEIQDIRELSEAVCTFARWLSEKVTIQNRWFSSLLIRPDNTATRHTQ